MIVVRHFFDRFTPGPIFWQIISTTFPLSAFLPASSSPTTAPPDSLHSRLHQLQHAATLPLSREERPLTDGHHPPLLFAPLLWPHLCQKYRQAENGQVIMDDLSLTSGSPSLWALPTALSVFPLCSIERSDQTCFVFVKLYERCLWHACKCNHRNPFYSYSAWTAGVTSATSLRKKDTLGIRKLRCVRNYVGIVARWIDKTPKLWGNRQKEECWTVSTKKNRSKDADKAADRRIPSEAALGERLSLHISYVQFWRSFHTGLKEKT